MTESESDAAPETVPSGDAANSGATTELRAGGTPSVTDPGPGARPRIGKKSAWALGGVIAVAILSVVLSATARLSLSGGKTPITMAGAASSASPSASVPGPDAGTVAPLVSKSAASHKAASTPSAARTGAATTTPSPAATTAPAVSSPATQPTSTTSKAAAATVSVPKPVGWWYLNDDTGTTAQDAMGLHPATGSNIAWCTTGNGNCAVFNGTDSDFVTSGPVLDTAPGRSFTVSAWVYLTAIPADGKFATIVSQDGPTDSGFYLQYSGANQRWAFAASTRALSTSAPALDTWTHLVGVFDASDKQLRLYVNGVLQGTATGTVPFAATGPMAIGRAQFDGKPTDWFIGDANQIQVWNVALTTAQVDKI